MSAKYEEYVVQVDAVRKAMRCSVIEAKASVQTTFSRILESLRNREIFLLNQIDIIHQASEDLFTAEERQLLASRGPSASKRITGCICDENGDDQLISDLAGCSVTFDADLAALRDAVLQFGCVTTSRVQSAGDRDVENWLHVPCRYSHGSDAQSSFSADAENSQDEFVLVDNSHLVLDNDDDELVEPSVVLTPDCEQHHFELEKSYGGRTVYPEVGVYVSVSEATRQCHVSYEPEADNSDAGRWQTDLDLEKTAFADCCEPSSAVDTCSYGLNISPITGYIRKVVLQPAELWLTSALSNAVGNDQFEVVSTEDIHIEASAVNGFVRYVEAVSAEPLEYWLCPNCELEFPNTDETSFEDVAAESANCACIEQNNPQPEQGNDHAIDFWLPKSSSEDHLDKMGVVINDANGMAISFELESAIRGYPSGNTVSGFSNDYYFAVLKSKPANYWLCSGNQKLSE